VESVAWVAERKDVLSGLFFMLILWRYAVYARARRPTSGQYVLIVVLFALGLMCKPTLVTVPFLLLLFDYWPLRRIPEKSLRDLLVEKIPFFALSALSCIATVFAQEKTINTLDEFSLGSRIGNAMVSYIAYIGQMIWPAKLAVFYPFPDGGWTIAQSAVAFLVLVIISVAFFLGRNKYPYLLVGWLWFLGMLIPMIGIVQVGNQTRADRYTYLTQIGLYVLLTWGAIELLTKWPRFRQTLIVIAVLVVTALIADSYTETSFWQNSETLWNRALVTTSRNHIAHANLGNALMKKEGRVDEGIAHCRQALEIHSNYPEAHNYLGYGLASKGQWAEAITSFRAALRRNPNFPEAHNNLAISLSQLGKHDEALAECQAGLLVKKDYVEGHCNMALILLQLGRRDEAFNHLREALRLKPNDPQIVALAAQLGVR